MCVFLFLASIARLRQFNSVFCGAFNAFWIGVARFLVVLKKKGNHKTRLNRSFLTVACLLKSAQKPWRAVVRSATASWEGGGANTPAVSTKRCDGVLRCKSKREKWRAGPKLAPHLKIGRTSCSDAMIKLKNDIDRRARDAPDEP